MEICWATSFQSLILFLLKWKYLISRTIRTIINYSFLSKCLSLCCWFTSRRTILLNHILIYSYILLIRKILSFRLKRCLLFLLRNKAKPKFIFQLDNFSEGIKTCIKISINCLINRKIFVLFDFPCRFSSITNLIFIIWLLIFTRRDQRPHSNSYFNILYKTESFHFIKYNFLL